MRGGARAEVWYFRCGLATAGTTARGVGRDASSRAGQDQRAIDAPRQTPRIVVAQGLGKQRDGHVLVGPGAGRDRWRGCRRGGPRVRGRRERAPWTMAWPTSTPVGHPLRMIRPTLRSRTGSRARRRPRRPPRTARSRSAGPRAARRGHRTSNVVIAHHERHRSKTSSWSAGSGRTRRRRRRQHRRGRVASGARRPLATTLTPAVTRRADVRPGIRLGNAVGEHRLPTWAAATASAAALTKVSQSGPLGTKTMPGLVQNCPTPGRATRRMPPRDRSASPAVSRQDEHRVGRGHLGIDRDRLRAGGGRAHERQSASAGAGEPDGLDAGSATRARPTSVPAPYRTEKTPARQAGLGHGAVDSGGHQGGGARVRVVRLDDHRAPGGQG